MSEPKQPLDAFGDDPPDAEERHRAKTMSRKEMARDLRRQRQAGGVDPEELALMRRD